MSSPPYTTRSSTDTPPGRRRSSAIRATGTFGSSSAQLPEHPDVLEIGCGSGIEPTPTFARCGGLVGIDISAAQIERARVAVPEAEFIHGDVTDATFAPGTFDAVVALFALTHIPGADLSGLLTRVGRWFRAGGLFLGTFGSGLRHETIVDDWLGAPMFSSGFDEETNERLIEDAGLTIVESRLEPMQEPESEPGRGPETVSFHWIVAEKPQPRGETERQSTLS